MLKPEIPRDEDERLESLRRLRVLDTPPEERFDRVTRLASRLFEVPIALVSLVDEGRQWFKSRCGLEAAETPREISFCGHAILEDEILVVPDATRDPRFSDNPLVTDEPRIRFYAGCPLRAPTGHLLGTLCIIDRRERELLEEERQTLRDLGAVVESELAAVELATVDALTGLANRRAFEMLAHHSMAIAGRSPHPLVLVFVDLDGFKAINDELGHEAGDAALCEMSRILKQVFRDSDVVARIGGDEFCVLLSGTPPTQMAPPVSRLAVAVEEHNTTRPAGHPIAYSVGCAAFEPERHTALAEWMREADAAMYRDKRARRQR